MNIVIDCEVSLSKKLRKLMGKNGKVTLMTYDLESGCGNGKLIINTDNVNGDVSIDKSETSIMVTPKGIEIAAPTANSGSGVENLFSSIPEKSQEEPLIKKLAVVNAPEKHEVASVVSPVEDRIVPDPIVKNESFKKFASNLDELMDAVFEARGKDSGIDIESIVDPRKRALAIEEKEKREAIDISAWVVNTKCGKLEIADLGMTLLLYVPFDLSRISAKRIAASKELQSFISNGWIKFLQPSETQAWLKKSEESQKDYSLPIFDNHEDAEDCMAGSGMSISHDERVVARSYGNRVATTSGQAESRNTMEITEEDLINPTEEEMMIQNLTGVGSPTGQVHRENSVQSETGVRRTSHGGQNSRPSSSPISLTGRTSSVPGRSGQTQHKSIIRVDN